MEKFGRAIACVGMQYGSEGKGAIASYLAPGISAAVRIGAANAGHTIYYQGRPYLMRQIPCGWVNPYAKLVIGISAHISLSVLLEEISLIERVLPIRDRLIIDPSAHVITEDQILRERSSGLAGRISSTSGKAGLGIGVSRADKLMRDQCLLAKDVPELAPFIGDTALFLAERLDEDQIVFFEGTQGFGLSVDHGYFPYTTSCDTTAQSLFAGCGVNPYGFDVEVIGVVRSYPIRVGGPSGPFNPDSSELSWSEVAKKAGFKEDITEKTSVTGAIRRVATFSEEGFTRACLINRPTAIALTFADHLDARVYEQERLTGKVIEFIGQLEDIGGIPVTLVKTGPHTTIDFDDYRRSMLRRMALV